jgi:G8 domain/Secretion system C-terminal sorting domain/Right handed beta helix region
MCSGKSTNVALFAPELWSDPATWGGTKPTAGDAVIIPAGKHIILDENSPALASLTVNGMLEFDRKNVSLTSNWIMVMGSLHVGSAAMPFTQQATINLTGTDMNQNIMGMGTRGLMVMGGTLELHGTPPTKTFTKINAHAPTGATNLTLAETVNWNVNDQIVVTPTDYMGTGATQKVSISALSGTSLTTSAGMNAYRWGLMQYATASGMSLTAAAAPASVVAGTPTQLDERAEVGNLTRNIVIQAPNDALWITNKFGCHIMIMRNGTTQGMAHVSGVEIRRGGQDGRLGRYPFHWHMLSYEGSATLADATGQYIRSSVVNESVHRGIVVHGTNGVEISKNVLYNIKGHGVFTEDASERRNIFNENLVLHVRNPTTPLKVHESNNDRGSAGFWISNPDNTITNNTAADCQGNAFWLAYPRQAWGLSQAVPMDPARILFGVFDNNTAHSNGNAGIFLDNGETDNLGNNYPEKYMSTTDGLDPQWPYPNHRRFLLNQYTTWKNAGHGIWNRSGWPDNDKVVSADNCASFFSGAGDIGLIKRSLIVGNSLNYNLNGITRPNTYGADDPVALASYHSTFDIKENFILNFPAVAGKSSGAFNLSDYYLIPVDKGLVRNTNNTLINSHPGVRIMPWEPQFTLAGALWDPHDYWGGSATQDNYYVYNNPFLTYGQTPTIVAPNAATSGGVVVEGPFYGVHSFVINKANSPYYPLMEIGVKRLNSSLVTVGTWSVGEGQNGQLLANMRHFSAHPTGIYELDFPTIPSVNDFSLTISSMLTGADYQVVGVEYNGDYLINGLFSSTAYNYMDFGESVPLPTNANNTKVYAAVANLAAVINAPAGEVYWQDRVNDKVWFKIKGGLNAGNPGLPPTDDVNLYKEFNVRAYGVFSPLPVELLDFKGENTASGNFLTWATVSENNNDGFDIEASADGSRFEKIGFLKGKGTSILKNDYTFLDATPRNEVMYYRLRQKDFDGKNELSKVISIRKTDKNNDIKVYPNPVLGNNEITVELANKTLSATKSVTIVNAIGQIIFEQKIPDTGILKINASDWQTGIYMLKSGNSIVPIIR